jgi:hypothetical protein
MSEELTVEQKREAEDFIDSMLKAIQASTTHPQVFNELMEIISKQLELIATRFDRIELALMDESKVGKA